MMAFSTVTNDLIEMTVKMVRGGGGESSWKVESFRRGLELAQVLIDQPWKL